MDVLEFQLVEHDPRTLDLLLCDKSTGGNIRWCTDAYAHQGTGFQPEDEMTPRSVSLLNDGVRPRALKSLTEQQFRTRDKGEVFTPAWVCNVQNSQVDRDWFGRDGVFNTPVDSGWVVNEEPIVFPPGKTWQEYTDNRVLEITCGEAPYLVGRYDAVSGLQVPLFERVGLLDRKLRVIGENAENDSQWMEWAQRAIESTYGFDYQGDNVLLARENVLVSYGDYYEERFGSRPGIEVLHVIANRIAWNIWQMDGYTCTAPYSSVAVDSEPVQLSLFDGCENSAEVTMVPARCKVFNWRRGRSEYFDDCLGEWG